MPYCGSTQQLSSDRPVNRPMNNGAEHIRFYDAGSSLSQVQLLLQVYDSQVRSSRKTALPAGSGQTVE